MGIALDTANLRADFVEKAENPHHIGYLKGMVASSRRSGDNLFPVGWDGEEVAADLKHIAAKAELFTITKEMQELVAHASESLPPQTIEAFDLPSNDGWLHLPVPFVIRDVRNEPIPIRTIMWSTRILHTVGARGPNGGLKDEEPGLIIYFSSQTGDDDPAFARLTPEQREEVFRQIPKTSVWGGQSAAFGRYSWSIVDTVDGSRENVDAAKDEVNTQLRTINYDFDPESMDEDGFFVGESFGDGKVRAQPNPVIQFMKTYWHFCQSELTDMEKEPLPRQYRRAMERKGLPSGPVSIVVLRKRKYESKGDGGGWELQYKYIRRGHWRRQQYGSGTAKYHRYIWIAPTRVGPDDAPWRDGPVVNILAR